MQFLHTQEKHGPLITKQRGGARTAKDMGVHALIGLSQYPHLLWESWDVC